jgi:hypothetical protein
MLNKNTKKIKINIIKKKINKILKFKILDNLNSIKVKITINEYNNKSKFKK